MIVQWEGIPNFSLLEKCLYFRCISLSLEPPHLYSKMIELPLASQQPPEASDNTPR